jgi:plastocyanin
MRRALVIGAAMLALARDASSQSSAGSVSGKVLLLDGGKVVTHDDVWVYLVAVKPRRVRSATPPKDGEIRQVKERFDPHVLVVPVGTTVWFPNYDHQEHNVFSPTDGADFDLKRYNEDHKGKPQKFDSAADVEIYCDIHKCMWARVKVVDADSSWIANVDASGKFQITGVPAGTYQLHAWTYDGDDQKQTIEVKAGAAVEVPEIHLQLRKMKSHRRLDGSEYPPGQYTPCHP